jgi:hypothetical protein
MLCEFTKEGFQKISFTDENGKSCIIQQGRICPRPGDSALLIGVDNDMMYLGRDKIKYLVEKLNMFLNDEKLFE